MNDVIETINDILKRKVVSISLALSVAAAGCSGTLCFVGDGDNNPVQIEVKMDEGLTEAAEKGVWIDDGLEGYIEVEDISNLPDDISFGADLNSPIGKINLIYDGGKSYIKFLEEPADRLNQLNETGDG